MGPGKDSARAETGYAAGDGDSEARGRTRRAPSKEPAAAEA
jgi:hypothetical protein